MHHFSNATHAMIALGFHVRALNSSFVSCNDGLHVVFVVLAQSNSSWLMLTDITRILLFSLWPLVNSWGTNLQRCDTHQVLYLKFCSTTQADTDFISNISHSQTTICMNHRKKSIDVFILY